MLKFERCGKRRSGETVAVISNMGIKEYHNKEQLKDLIFFTRDCEKTIVYEKALNELINFEQGTNEGYPERDYIVDVEWFYDIMPSNKHRKKEHVIASDMIEAETIVYRMYPNACIHSTKLKH